MKYLIKDTRRKIQLKRKAIHALGATRIQGLNAGAVRYPAEQLYAMLRQNRSGVRLLAFVVGALAFALSAMHDHVVMGAVSGGALFLLLFFFLPSPAPQHFSSDESVLARQWANDRKMIMDTPQFRDLHRAMLSQPGVTCDPFCLREYTDCIRLVRSLHGRRSGYGAIVFQ